MSRQSEPADVPVAIIGAGPTGLTAAILLASYGVRCLVLERWDDIYPQPRAVHLDDEIHRLLGRLGVAEKFAAISRPALGLQVLDEKHRVLTRFERSESEGVHGYPQANLFDQPELERILRNRLAELHLATLRGGAEVTAAHQDDDGVVLEVFDRHREQPEQIRAQYVLGCDGANSLLRSSIDAVMEDLEFEQQWLVVDVETGHDLNQWDGVHQISAPNRAATYMRIGERRYRWEFQLREGESADDYATLDALHPLIRPWTGNAPLTDLEVVRTASYTFRAQIADRWRDRRIFLLGDAAHLTPPFVGQGMGSGLRDAHNIAWKLAAVLDRRLPASVLDSYQIEREPHARAMIRLAMMIGFAMTGGGLAGDLFRRVLLPRAHLLGLGHILTDSATPRLQPSALIEQTRRKAELSGRLCPNALLADGRRFDEVGPGFILVTLDALDAADRIAAEDREVTVLPVDAGSTLGRWLGRGRVRAALIRPDGTVFACGDDRRRLCNLLEYV